MRRRSERKKSADVSSPAIAKRGRRRKSPSISENPEECTDGAEETIVTDSHSRDSSDEPLAEIVGRRARRRRTPVNDISTPSKRKSRRTESPEAGQIDAIPEEENCAIENISKNKKKELEDDTNKQFRANNDDDDDEMMMMREIKETVRDDKDVPTNQEVGTPTKRTEVTAAKINEDVTEKEVIGNSRSLSPKAIVEEKSKTSDVLDIKEDSEEAGGQYEDNEDIEKRSFASITNEKKIVCNELESMRNEINEYQNGNDIIIKTTDASSNKDANENDDTAQSNAKKSPQDHTELDSNENSVMQIDTNSIEAEQLSKDSDNKEAKKCPSVQEIHVRTRKRKWLTKKSEDKTPILAISSDSLKGLIEDVHPVPLSDVHLESSSDVAEVMSEREEGEKTPTPERKVERRPDSVEKIVEKPIIKRTHKESISSVPNNNSTAAADVIIVPAGGEQHALQRSPSPPRNKTSCVLYITNLVRPFTVLQLKGLLARTGKIVENGFWIDRIKSKCYVQYETEDEAIETRHALHGVRWPVSNPKCLNVDFGNKADIERAIESTKEDAPKLGQENKDNMIIGTGWNRGDRYDEMDRKTRPVREWDVGKKENSEREKQRDVEKRRSRERERERERDRGRERGDRDRERERERERDQSSNREHERNSNDRRSRNRGRERSYSVSPGRKIHKKENEPPLRLLDDLFRKTKSTPCVYWLPLTPEQIAEKEAQRQKRIHDHKERVKQREVERDAEREKEREMERSRGSDRDRDRDRDRRRSSDRRRSRSRDRRRY